MIIDKNDGKFPIQNRQSIEMRYLKLILKIIVGLIILLLLAFFVLNEKLPTGKKGPEAEQMAQNLLTAVNYAAWDTLPYAQWTFSGRNSYVWDRTNNTALVSWEDMEVHLKMNDVDGIAFQGGQQVTGEAKNALIQKAWSNWCNDSFWFNAPAKIMDPGTERSIVTNDDGSKSLMVTYVSGGVTPGDSYLWSFDDNGMPKSWKMWTKIIPIGGVNTTWDGWITLPGGAKISSSHVMGPMTLAITNIKGGFTWQEMGYDSNPIKL